jgi:hypothetical protein
MAVKAFMRKKNVKKYVRYMSLPPGGINEIKDIAFPIRNELTVFLHGECAV